MELEAENRIEGEWRERYNIAPTQQVAIVRPDADTGKRELVALRWGLVPFWADDVKVGYTMINARAETLVEKKSFKGPLQKRRCVVLADGFYEWKKLGGKDKQPYYIKMRDDRVFAFAGLWDVNKKISPTVESCTIVTTTPNKLMSELHDRMPVILGKQGIDFWLDPKNDNAEQVVRVLGPYPYAKMEAYAVGPTVNSVKNQGSECMEPMVGGDRLPARILSLGELNSIADEFGITFYYISGAKRLQTGFGKSILEIQGALADRCEEHGSRWCEAIRETTNNPYGFFIDVPADVTVID